MKPRCGRSVVVQRALSALASFLNERGEKYRSEMSSPITAKNACSRLSPYLAFGAISMREVAQATWRRQIELKKRRIAIRRPVAWINEFIHGTSALALPFHAKIGR